MARQPQVASVPERIRGGLSALLMIAAFTISCWATDTQTQAWFLFAGMGFMLMTITIVFDKFDGFEDPSQK